MRRRNIHIQFWLNEKEFNEFDNTVRKSGLTRSAYFRHLTRGLIPPEAPPIDYFNMMKELRFIGNNLNQIAKKANMLNIIETEKYDNAIKDFNETLLKISTAVLSPKELL